ncbi:MAG: PAS domain S-box protein, partial [Pseudobdellovibrionaceae bacterium]|nr:PAS domain S-box protein [Pseudobdellovibrionaceae bacterium]
MNRSIYDAQASLDRCHFLANSYLTFLSTLSYGVTKNNLTQLLLPEIADWYALYLLDSNGKMYLENCSHSDPSKTDLIWELNRRFPFSQDSVSGPMHVTQTKQPEYVTDVPPPTLSGLFLNKDHVGLLELIGLNSYICVPLVDHETSMGSLFLAVNEMSGRRYGEADAALAADFGKSAAFALVNARTAGTAVAQVHELLDDLDAIVWESDINRSRYTFISKKAENILGYSVAKWLTERNVWQEIIHPADRYQVLSMFSVAASKGRDLDIEYRAVTQDGRTIWIRDILHIVVDSKGERTGVRGVIIDVTEQHEVMDHLHQHEAELLQSQKRLTSLISGVNAILWESDVARSTYHFVSEQAFSILGYTADQWLSEKDFWSRLIHPFDRDRITQLYLKAAANGRAEVLEYRVTTAQGQTKWIRDIFHFETTNNQPISARGIVLDVTDAHEKAETLARNERALRLFYENVKDYAIVMLDNDGIITSWNVAAQKMTGYSVEDAIGQHLDLLFTQEDRAIHAAADEIANVRLTGSVENNRWMMRRDGSRFWCQGVLTALFNQDRQLLGLIKFARDMTEQKLLEDELKKAKEAAEVASETKSQFLANMSHELRTPLGAMIGFADELLDPHLEEEKRVQFIGIIRRSGEQLVALIDDILDLSKVEAGRLQVEKQPSSIKS